MTNMTQEILNYLAERYLVGDISIEELAIENGMSKSTLVGYFNRKKAIKLPLELQWQVDKVKEKRWMESKATYGNKGNFSLTNEEIVAAAKAFVSGDYLALRDIAAFYGVAPATIYNLFSKEMLGEELYNEVKLKYEENVLNGRFNKVI